MQNPKLVEGFFLEGGFSRIFANQNHRIASNNPIYFFYFLARLRKIMKSDSGKVGNPAFHATTERCRLRKSSACITLVLINDITNSQSKSWRWLLICPAQGKENCARRSIGDLARSNQELTIFASQSVERQQIQNPIRHNYEPSRLHRLVYWFYEHSEKLFRDLRSIAFFPNFSDVCSR